MPLNSFHASRTTSTARRAVSGDDLANALSENDPETVRYGELVYFKMGARNRGWKRPEWLTLLRRYGWKHEGAIGRAMLSEVLAAPDDRDLHGEIVMPRRAKLPETVLSDDGSSIEVPRSDHWLLRSSGYGCRISEALALRWDRHVIVGQPQIPDHVWFEQVRRTRSEKTANNRPVPLYPFPERVALLAELRGFDNGWMLFR